RMLQAIQTCSSSGSHTHEMLSLPSNELSLLSLTVLILPRVERGVPELVCQNSCELLRVGEQHELTGVVSNDAFGLVQLARLSVQVERDVGLVNILGRHQCELS